MKAYEGVEIQLHSFLISALNGSEWSASRPGSTTSRERAPDIHWIGGLAGPTAVLDAVTKRKNPCRESNPGLPTCSLVTKLAEISWILQYGNSV